MWKFFLYALPISIYFFLFFFSIVYLSAKWQRSCIDIGLKFLCVENRDRNGTVFYDKNETLKYELCIAAFMDDKRNITYFPSSTFFYFTGSIFLSFFIFVFSWYFGVRKIKYFS